MVVLIEDINMPMFKGAREVVKEMVGGGGWHESKSLEYRIVQDTTIFTNLSETSRPVSNRLIHIFAVFGMFLN